MSDTDDNADQRPSRSRLANAAFPLSVVLGAAIGAGTGAFFGIAGIGALIGVGVGVGVGVGIMAAVFVERLSEPPDSN